jgi:hypothetical protein
MAHNPSDDGVVLFGGNHYDPAAVPTNTFLADTWAWDGTAWTLQVTPVAPSARYEAAMSSIHGAAILFGGLPATGSTPLGDTWEWDGTGWTQLTPTSAPSARSSAAAAMAERDGDPTFNLLLFGGNDGSTQLNDTWEFAR